MKTWLKVLDVFRGKRFSYFTQGGRNGNIGSCRLKGGKLLPFGFYNKLLGLERTTQNDLKVENIKDLVFGVYFWSPCLGGNYYGHKMRALRWA